MRPPRALEQRKRIRKLSDAGTGDKHRSTADRLREDLFGPEDEGVCQHAKSRVLHCLQ
jgi:hypothetical protein